MRKVLLIPALFFVSQVFSQKTYTRTELPTLVDYPWEIMYGPDGYLWLTEKGGRVSRVDPTTGDKKIIYTASDYFAGHISECCTRCHKPSIGAGTFGMALHPHFANAQTAYIYFAYSYNSSTDTTYSTKFRIKRLLWDAKTEKVIEETNLVSNLPTGWDHLGGRLIAVEQGANSYLYFSVGDNGVSEDNAPDCYESPETNPNNNAQDPKALTGKIHRFNLDGTIPSNNPLPGNSFYTRGHRNPQGLMYNYNKNILYDIEHGDRTDDEINILRAGMNYGWKQVRGYHNDGNYNGELDYIYNYKAYPGISNDALQEPMYAWSAASQYTSPNNTDWGTVAPSDGLYYGMDAIPEFSNSLLVVTLKKGKFCSQEMYVFRLAENGIDLMPSTVEKPNPQKLFAEDQAKNGRLRDLTVSADGGTFYLISNNGGPTKDKIIVYKFPIVEKPKPILAAKDFKLDVFPNPCSEWLNINCTESLQSLSLYNMLGEQKQAISTTAGINIGYLPQGTYYLKIKTESGQQLVKRVVKN